MTRAMSKKETGQPAIFLDRDGVIIVEKDFQIEIDSVEFFPDTMDALKATDPRFRKVVISNQSGIARGYFTEGDVIELNRFISTEFEKKGIIIDGWYFCPHGPDDGCECRKPKPGMLIKAAEELSLNLGKSWIIGDKSSDIEAGQSAGLKTILVTTGYAGKEPGASNTVPDYLVNNLSDAVEIVNRSIN